MTKSRKVIVYKYSRPEGQWTEGQWTEVISGQVHYDKIFDYHGLFHQFGVDYEEFETGPGNFSTGIIEKPDGSISNVPVDLIAFCDGDAGCESEEHW